MAPIVYRFQRQGKARLWIIHSGSFLVPLNIVFSSVIIKVSEILHEECLVHASTLGMHINYQIIIVGLCSVSLWRQWVGVSHHTQCLGLSPRSSPEPSSCWYTHGKSKQWYLKCLALPLTWGFWIVFLAPGFHLTQPGQSQALEKLARG